MRAVENPALRLLKAFGSKTGVAKRFGVSREAVRLWIKEQIPTDRALDAEEATAGTAHPISALEVLQYAKWRAETSAAAVQLA